MEAKIKKLQAEIVELKNELDFITSLKGNAYKFLITITYEGINYKLGKNLMSEDELITIYTFQIKTRENKIKKLQKA